MPIKIKTPEQITGIRKSCQLAANTLQYVSKYIAPGVTTQQLNDIAHGYIVKHRGIPAPLNYNGFPKSICTSVNEVVCHGIPGKYKLQHGDIITIDVTTILDRYYGDCAATFFVDACIIDAMYLMHTTKQALQEGINQIKPGNYLGNIGYTITKVAESNRLGVVFSYGGHGTGLEFHEEPFVNHYITEKDTGIKLVPGMIFTVEPMLCLGCPVVRRLNDGWTVITEDGSLCAQEEHTVLVTDNGYEILTLVNYV